MKFKLDTIRNAITSRAGSKMLAVQSKSPAILFAVGVGGVIAATVMACRATLKVDDVLDEHQEALTKINYAVENIESYTETDLKQDKLRLMIRASGRLAKLYLPGVAVGIVSICALTGSHVILSRRNVGLTAAYAALDKGFREYRDRVVSEFGKDKDDEYRYGVKEREIVEETKTGPVVTTVKSFDPNKVSGYAKIFSDGCAPWEKNSESNRIFLQCQQNYFNQRLQARGHVFLNEVYRALGIPETKAGQSVGWALSPDHDNYISFGIFENIDDERVRAFVNGDERSILLDFNVNGPILNVLSEEI
jgi:hypothetical protein